MGRKLAPRRNRLPAALWALLAAVAAMVLALAPVASAQEVPELKINSKRYIVIDADTGEVFAQWGAHDRAAMASLTKVFTAIEAIESAPLDLEITTTEDDVFNPSTSSVMGLGPNERLSLEDLLYGLMLPSGNDAAYAIARVLGGSPDDDEASVAAFVERMNTRVRDLGLVDTHLVNPHGWGVPNHYSTVHDLAVFTMYALQYPTFRELISTYEHATADGVYTLYNNNRLLQQYDDLLGGKTGYDNDAGWCLIEVAQRDGSMMISVTMDGLAPDDWYDDNRVLLEYAFEQKAKRLKSGAPIAGEVVAYRDPNAAVIARSATAGVSLGVAPTAPPARHAPEQAAGDAEGGATARAVAVPRIADGTGGPSPQLLAALGVAAAIILARTVGTFRHFGTERTGAAPLTSQYWGDAVRLSGRRSGPTSSPETSD